jgi:hypothetical protein
LSSVGEDEGDGIRLPWTRRAVRVADHPADLLDEPDNACEGLFVEARLHMDTGQTLLRVRVARVPPQRRGELAGGQAEHGVDRLRRLDDRPWGSCGGVELDAFAGQRPDALVAAPAAPGVGEPDNPGAFEQLDVVVERVRRASQPPGERGDGSRFCVAECGHNLEPVGRSERLNRHGVMQNQRAIARVLHGRSVDAVFKLGQFF